MSKFIDMTGYRFGRLTVIELGERTKEPSGRSRARWKCVCDCGNEALVSRDNLISGRTQSCGCYGNEQRVESRKKYNKYEFTGDICVGKLSNCDDVFIVDAEDYDRIKNMCWVKNKSGYVVARDSRVNKTVYLHRVIVKDIPNEMVIDHKNRNKLDNRKDNLRMCTQLQNSMNCEKNSNELSGAGVKFVENNHTNPWRATITNNGEHIHIGYYATMEEAIMARTQVEKELRGEFSPK